MEWGVEVTLMIRREVVVGWMPNVRNASAIWGLFLKPGFFGFLGGGLNSRCRGERESLGRDG